MLKDLAHQHGYRRSLTKFAARGPRTSDVKQIIPYDPVYAAAQELRHGVGQRGGEVAGKAKELWHEFLRKSAPARAGLTAGALFGVPTAGASYYSTRDNEELSPQQRAAIAAISGTVAGLPVGSGVYTNRKRIQSALDHNHELFDMLARTGRYNPATAKDYAQTVPSVWDKAVDAAVRQAPDRTYTTERAPMFTPRGLEPKNHVETQKLRDLASELKSRLDVRFGPAPVVSGKDVATEEINRALRAGLTDASGPSASKSPLLDRIRANDPTITDKQLRRRLHPDAVAHDPTLDPVAAAEAYRAIGQARAGSGEHFSDVTALGKDIRKKRLEMLDRIREQQRSAFPGGLNNDEMQGLL